MPSLLGVQSMAMSEGVFYRIQPTQVHNFGFSGFEDDLNRN